MSGERKRSSKLWRYTRRIMFFAVILGALAGGIVWAKNLVLARQVQFVTAQEGTLETVIPIDALVANTEQIITTSTAGKLDKLYAQGERVRRGSPVARIIAQNSGGKVELTSPISGLVNYVLDGQEGLVTVKNLQEWELSKFQGITETGTAGETFQSGQAVLKITDNLIPTYLFFTLNKPGLQLKPGDSITLLLEQKKLNAKIVRVNTGGPNSGIVVSLSSFLSESLGKRRIKLNWLDQDPPKGQVIPSDALLNHQGTKGVFILKDGVVTWQPVTIKAQTADKLCVDGLKSDTLVITTPSYVHEGQILSK